MILWEYKVVCKSHLDLAGQLKELGEWGWELTAWDLSSLALKRPIEIEPAGHLGIVAGPKPPTPLEALNAAAASAYWSTPTIAEWDEIKRRIANLEGLEASRRAAKDAQQYCYHCGKPIEGADIIKSVWQINGGVLAYCPTCWNALPRNVGRTVRTGTGNIESCGCFACIHGLGKCYSLGFGRV